MKLSIIIPVYNAEKYLEKCLASIVSQNLKVSFEVILINDGSTDSSLEIAKSFKDKISNFTIFSHPNQGEAVSRNVALDLAKGEYITFLDSDDYYEKEALNTALDIIDQYNLDILYLKIRQIDEQGNFKGYLADIGLSSQVLSGFTHHRRPFPATIYSRSVIGPIKFPAGIIVGPDSVFNALVQSRAKRVSFTKYAVYNYTYRTDSLTKQGYTLNAFNGFVKGILEIRRYEQQNFLEDVQAKSFFERMYLVFITRIIELSIMPNWNARRYNELLDVLRKTDLLYILDKFEPKYKFVNSSFNKFKYWQKYLAFKTQVYKILHRA